MDIKGDQKPLPANLIKSSESNKSINTLPDYQIRTMKDDLAELGLKKLEKEAKGIPIHDEEIVRPPKPAQQLEKEVKKEIFPTKEIPAPPRKSAIPGTEELVSPGEELIIPSRIKSVPQSEEMSSILQEEEFKMPALSYDAPVTSPKRKILSLVLMVLIVAGLGIGALFLVKLLNKEVEPTPPPPITTPKLSPSIIPVDETKIISLVPDMSLFEILREETKLIQPTGTFKRVGVLKNEKEFLSSIELLQNLEVAILPYAASYFSGNYNLLLYAQSNGKRLGLITEIQSPEALKGQLSTWEATMLDDFKNFYPAQVPGARASQVFLDDTYLNVAIRYVNLPRPDLTLNYTILNNLLIIGTSKETIYTIIEKILGIR